MILKIITLFLCIMVVLAMMGRLKLFKKTRTKVNKPQKCPKCGNIIFDSIECRCHSSHDKS